MNPVRLALDIASNRVGAVPRPRWCTYLVCYRCNARCGMCDSWKMKRGNEMSAEQAREVFARIGRLDVVRLTGGEPFLREDFGDVARAVFEASRPAVVHVTTNGSFPDRVADFVRRFPAPRRLRFMVSLDGLQATHDANRGAEVGFATAMQTVHLLAGERGRGVKVSVNHTVISRASLAEHEALAQQCAALGVEVQAVLAYEESSMYGRRRHGQRSDDLIPLRGYPLHPALPYDEALQFARGQLDGVSALRDPIVRVGKRYYLRGLVQRLEGAAQPRPKPRCVALRSHIRLLPDGSVPVCQFNTQRLGSLLTQSFDAVWHGPAAREQRAWVDACTGCWAECEVIPNAVYSGDIAREVFRGR